MMSKLLKSFQKIADLLIFGMKLININEPFRIGSLILYPHFDIRSFLKGYNADDISFIIESNVVYAKYQPMPGLRTPLFTPILGDDGLIPFRLLKPGWLSALNVIPITKGSGIEMRGTLDPNNLIFGQIWAEPMVYKLTKVEAAKTQRIYDNLVAIPNGYLELAMRRFSRSYSYYIHNKYAGISELDDCLVDLVIALESITSRGGDSIRQSIALRIALLLENSLIERRKVEKSVKKFYDHRSAILHGSEKDKISEKDHDERFLNLEDLRDLVRRTINASIVVLKTFTAEPNGTLKLPEIMAEIIDNFLYSNLVNQKVRKHIRQSS